ncbi:MAG TPA: ABC transporter substrate-binding protein [Stellaceae bacterium]|nr:ABC transporter substrate-binding protein [Stellaceae bacterium]
MPRHFFSVGVIAVAFGLLAGAPHGNAAMDPKAFIGDLGQQGIQTLGPNVPPAQRVARFHQLFQADFDVQGIGRFAIGRYWQAFSPEQQQEFIRLFRDYTVQAYAEKLGQYGGAQFRVLSAAPAGDGMVVSSEVIRANGAPVRIDWHVAPAGDGYKVTDVYVDGVSMKVTQRDEFAKIIQNNGGQPSALLAVLRQQLREGPGVAGPGNRPVPGTMPMR